ncbi:hypothetical protein [Rubritalea tangerina]
MVNDLMAFSFTIEHRVRLVSENNQDRPRAAAFLELEEGSSVNHY